jgi:prepilin-type N-terminal cleavage/methylation domain-containing protein
LKVVVKTAIRQSAFTLLELLVVISILGILAGLAVPALKSLGKSNVNLGASRQLLGDLGHARQLAIANHTTVYMVFVPTNFWVISGMFPNTWWNNLTAAQRAVATNLCDKQLSGYTFVASGTVGDQPGRHSWHYLVPWQSLPDGTFIAQQKFYTTNAIVDSVSGATFPISEFNYTNTIPFPTETSANNFVALPYIAFNSFGQLVSGRDEYIPLAHGSVLPPVNQNKVLQLGLPSIQEVPPGNSTNSSYNVMHIDWLTGRAVLEFQKVQ